VTETRFASRHGRFVIVALLVLLLGWIFAFREPDLTHVRIIKVPKEQVTFVILANSDGLSRWRRLGDEANVLASPAATLFLNWYSTRRAGI